MAFQPRLARLYRIWRSSRLRVVRVWAKAKLTLVPVTYGKGLILDGSPIIKCVEGSNIIFGDHVILASESYSTALGVNHPVKIETLAPGARITIGSHTGISGGSLCAQESIWIGEGCLFGANVMVADTDFHPIAASGRCYASEDVVSKPIKIGNNVFLGTNTIVLKGVTIGDNSIVGAGSVVTRSVPANSIVAGNPCVIVRFLTEKELAGVPQ